MVHRAFSLIEMLVATALTSVLMGGVMIMLGGVHRDARTMSTLSDGQMNGVMILIARDLGNAETFTGSSDGRRLEITGNVGVERASLEPDGRRARVVYVVDERGVFRRQQVYLDAPDRPQPWSDLAAVDVQSLSVANIAQDDGARVRVTIETRRAAVTRDLRLR